MNGVIGQVYLIKNKIMKNVMMARRITDAATIKRNALSTFPAVLDGPRKIILPYLYHTSENVKAIIKVKVEIASNSNPFKNLPSYFRCMKNMSTSPAFNEAMKRFITMLYFVK